MDNTYAVSIITPCYNGEKYLRECIESVVAQTFLNWEMIIVDDGSTDNSARIIHEFIQKDSRIKSYKIKTPSGSPTKPRNIAIEKSTGRFIAFLDCDDMWEPQKIEKQINLFKDKEVAIVYANYAKINNVNISKSRIVNAPHELDYKTLLKGNSIGCLTAMYDTDKVGRLLLFQYCGHEDYVMWLTILGLGYKAKNANQVLATYRISSTSVSKNKFKALKWTWKIYTNILKLGYIKSSYYFGHYAFKALIKYFR